MLPTYSDDRGLRVLVVWAPQVLSYFNAGHHLGLYMTAGYLRKRPDVGRVEVLDASVSGGTWKDVGDILYQGKYDVIAVMNDLDGIDGLPRLVRYARRLCPQAMCVTFGRLSGMNPEFFQKYDLDAVVSSGDYETGVAAAIDAVTSDRRSAPGVLLRTDGQWSPPAGPGTYLAADEWALPDVNEIPYASYDVLYRRDANKFCGIPFRRELVVPASRGCPIGCSYCEVPGVFGRLDRRLTVERTVTYIEESFRAQPFEYVAFYSPTFTLDRKWTLDLCREMTDRGSRYPWKCATTTHHLDEKLIARMGESGCVRVSVGLETLDGGGAAALPRIKRGVDDELTALAAWTAAAGIELNCFVIIGLPGTDHAGALRTVRRVRELGARVRPTIYSPIDQMRPDMSAEEIARFNRQLFVEGTEPDDAETYADYGLLFGAEPAPTQVFTRIPQRTG
jgi:anaerobic magnesium-protoporphyrin IX monomethyl ester cyclase